MLERLHGVAPREARLPKRQKLGHAANDDDDDNDDVKKGDGNFAKAGKDSVLGSYIKEKQGEGGSQEPVSAAGAVVDLTGGERLKLFFFIY